MKFNTIAFHTKPVNQWLKFFFAVDLNKHYVNSRLSGEGYVNAVLRLHMG